MPDHSAERKAFHKLSDLLDVCKPTWGLTASGLLVRKLIGTYEGIAKALEGSLEDVYPPIPGYSRMQDFQVSKDGKRCDFEIRDTQMRNASASRSWHVIFAPTTSQEPNVVPSLQGIGFPSSIHLYVTAQERPGPNTRLHCVGNPPFTVNVNVPPRLALPAGS